MGTKIQEIPFKCKKINYCEDDRTLEVIPRVAVDSTCMEIFKTQLDIVLSNLN